jgi:hypothetical protein
MGILALPWRRRSCLIVATLHVLGMRDGCMKPDPLTHRFTPALDSLVILWPTTAFVCSDIAHIAAAFTPVCRPQSGRRGIEAERTGCVVAIAVVVAPGSFVQCHAPADLLKVVRGQAGAGDTIRDLHTARGQKLLKAVWSRRPRIGETSHCSRSLRQPYRGYMSSLFARSWKPRRIDAVSEDYYLRAPKNGGVGLKPSAAG